MFNFVDLLFVSASIAKDKLAIWSSMLQANETELLLQEITEIYPFTKERKYAVFRHQLCVHGQK